MSIQKTPILETLRNIAVATTAVTVAMSPALLQAYMFTH
jgi:hypothetical protein